MNVIFQELKDDVKRQLTASLFEPSIYGDNFHKYCLLIIRQINSHIFHESEFDTIIKHFIDRYMVYNTNQNEFVKNFFKKFETHIFKSYEGNNKIIEIKLKKMKEIFALYQREFNLGRIQANTKKQTFAYFFKLYLKGGSSQKLLLFYINYINKDLSTENRYSVSQIKENLDNFSDYDFNLIINPYIKPVNEVNKDFSSEEDQLKLSLLGLRDYWDEIYYLLNTKIVPKVLQFETNQPYSFLDTVTLQNNIKDIVQTSIKKLSNNQIHTTLSDISFVDYSDGRKIKDRNFNKIKFGKTEADTFNLYRLMLNTELKSRNLSLFNPKSGKTLKQATIQAEILDISILEYYAWNKTDNGEWIIIKEVFHYKKNHEIETDWEHCVKTLEVHSNTLNLTEYPTIFKKIELNVDDIISSLYFYNIDMIYNDLDFLVKLKPFDIKTGTRKKRLQFIKKIRCYFEKLLEIQNGFSLEEIDTQFPKNCIDYLQFINKLLPINELAANEIWNLTLESSYLHVSDINFVKQLIIVFINKEFNKHNLATDPRLLLLKSESLISINELYTQGHPYFTTSYSKELNKIFMALMADYYHFTGSLNDDYIRPYAFITIMRLIVIKIKTEILNFRIHFRTIYNTLPHYNSSQEIPLPYEYTFVSYKSQFETIVINKMEDISEKILRPLVREWSYHFIKDMINISGLPYNAKIVIRGGLSTHLHLSGIFTNLIRNIKLSEKKLKLKNTNGSIILDATLFNNIKTNDIDLVVFYDDLINLNYIKHSMKELITNQIIKKDILLPDGSIKNINELFSNTIGPFSIDFNEIPFYSNKMTVIIKNEDNTGITLSGSPVIIEQTHHVIDIDFVAITAENKQYINEQFEDYDKINDYFYIYSISRLISEYTLLTSDEKKHWYRAHKYLRRILALTSLEGLGDINTNTTSRKIKNQKLINEFIKNLSTEMSVYSSDLITISSNTRTEELSPSIFGIYNV